MKVAELVPSLNPIDKYPVPLSAPVVAVGVVLEPVLEATESRALVRATPLYSSTIALIVPVVSQSIMTLVYPALAFWTYQSSRVSPELGLIRDKALSQVFPWLSVTLVFMPWAPIRRLRASKLPTETEDVSGIGTLRALPSKVLPWSLMKAITVLAGRSGRLRS